MLALDLTIELGKELVKILSSVKDKLWGSESAALEKLNEALDEIQKFYEATGKEISAYQALTFSNADAQLLQKNKTALFDFESGSMAVRIENAKGHCSKIKYIYTTYLDKWFKQVFGNSNSYEELRVIFESLSTVDEKMLTAIDELSNYLTDEATQVLNYIGDKDYEKTDERIFNSRVILSPIRREITELVTSLIALKNQFASEQ